jgi:hypothetical protein
MTERVNHEDLTVFGELLFDFMERAEISGRAELLEQVRKAGDDEPTEEQLLADMYDSIERPETPGSYEGVAEVLGINGAQKIVLGGELLSPHKASTDEGAQALARARSALARIVEYPVHRILRARVREVGYPVLFERLEDAGYEYPCRHVCRALDGAEELGTELVGDIAQVLELNREELRDLGEAHLYYTCVRQG